MPMGPHAMGDMAGLDIGAAGRRRRRAAGTLPDDPRFGVIADKLVELGRLGQKTSAGFYRYQPGSRDPLPDSEVADLIEQEAARLGVTRRQVSDEEIVERCVYPLINEAARILEEGIAQRPGDIDVVWVNGYGFPRVRGGPMQFADETGLLVWWSDCSSSRDNMARSTGRRLRSSSASWPRTRHSRPSTD